jgi:hypothetical protein
MCQQHDPLGVIIYQQVIAFAVSACQDLNFEIQTKSSSEVKSAKAVIQLSV